MKYTNILEKLMCIGDMTLSNWVYLAFIVISIIILILSLFKIIPKKHAFLANLISYISVFVYTIVINSKQLGKVWNNLVDNLFTNIYFPSTYTYLFVLIVIDIVTFVTLMKEKLSKTYKWINSIFFFIMQFIMILILDILSKNKIDIFAKTSLFSNKDLVMLLELSINIFIAWLIVITFTYLTNLVTEKVEKSEGLEEEDATYISPLSTVVEVEEAKTMSPITNTIPTRSMQTTVAVDDGNKFIPNIQTNSNVRIETTIDGIKTMSTTKQMLPNIPTQPIRPVTTPRNNQNIQPRNNQNIQYTNNINLDELIPQKQSPIIPTPSEEVFEKVVNNDLPVVREEKRESTDQYTLNDYRLFNKMLKEIKEYNHDNKVTIDKNIEYRLITKYSVKTFNMFKGMLKIYSN